MKKARTPRYLAALAVLLFLAAGSTPPSDAAGESALADYVGSERCASCHQVNYKGWVKTFHSTVVQDAKKDPSVILGDMNAPDLPFKKEDIYLTIGGHWDQRYLTKIGDDYFVLPRLWSVQSKKWRPYSTYGWQRRPYSKYCAGCHTVAFDPKAKGIIEHAVGCECCHGPGRRHASDPKPANIINPRALYVEQADEICASCHVRGKDPSGEYFFPVGYAPGKLLANYLVPLDKKEGESNQAAIRRLWQKWKSDREAQARSRCEVCGIHQTQRPQESQMGLDAVCMTCHEYEDRLPLHTHHKPGVRIGCADCHVQKNPDSNENRESNVHSYGFFLIHPLNCWDREIHKQCLRCHADKTLNWAYDMVKSWEKPVVIDH